MFTFPVPGPVTSPYGPRGKGFHNGVDFGWLKADPINSRNIYAPATGTVTVGWNALVGNFIELPTSIGLLRLAHFHSIAVKSGDRVVQGATFLGVMGETGSQSSGVHLHVDLYMKDGRVDPLPHFTIPFGTQPTPDRVEEEMAKNFVDRDSFKSGAPVDSTRCLTLWEGGRVEVYMRAPGKPGDAMAQGMSRAYGPHVEVSAGVFDTLAKPVSGSTVFPSGFTGQFTR